MLNKVFLIGNMGENPEVIHPDSDNTRCRFSLATSELKKVENGKFESVPSWHTVVAFGKIAANAGKNLRIGKQVLVEGKLQSQRWSDKQGVKHETYEIVASAIYPLGPKEKMGAVKQAA